MDQIFDRVRRLLSERIWETFKATETSNEIKKLVNI